MSGSIVLKIISEKPTMPGRVPQPSSCLLRLLRLSNGKFLLWLMGPWLVFLHGNNPSKIKASSHNKWHHPPALVWEQLWTHQPPAKTSQNPLRASRTEQGREIRDKHTTLLISNFLALDRKARAQLWSWDANVSHSGGMAQRPEQWAGGVFTLHCLCKLNQTTEQHYHGCMINIHTSHCVIASDYILSSHNSQHFHFAIAWVFKSTKVSHNLFLLHSNTFKHNPPVFQSHLTMEILHVQPDWAAPKQQQRENLPDKAATPTWRLLTCQLAKPWW